MYIAIAYAIKEFVPRGGKVPVKVRVTTISLQVNKPKEVVTVTHSVTRNLKEKDNKFKAKKYCLKALFDNNKFPKRLRTRVWKWFLQNNTRKG